MRRLLKILIPLLILGVSAATGFALIATGPQAERRPAKPNIPTVEVTTVQPRDYQVVVRSQGTVSPRTQSTLVAEVAGRVVEVTDNFRPGGFFEKGDLLLRIDPRDYQHAVTSARAELAQQRLALREEQARARQAERDWEKLAMGGEPNALTLRQPQLESARAAAAAAEARLEKAQVDLERTRIRAPYAGRILEKNVDVGQFVSPGSGLASVYAVDYVEVRLPLSDRQATYLQLPEAYRGDSEPGPGPDVNLYLRRGDEIHQWPARIVRTEGAVDTRSRQSFVVAQVDDPYAREADRPPLKIGQFVEATIDGRRLEGVFVVPRQAVRGENEVVVVNADNRIERRRLDVVWRDESNVVAEGGLEAGERLALTPLAYAANGAQVRVADDAGDGAAVKP